MSPLLASPNRGYADWQRVDNWDTGALWSPNIHNSAAVQFSPVMDVSRSAYIGGLLNCIQTFVWLQFNWAMDSGITQLTGSRNINLSPLPLNPAQFRLPNLGPYCQVTCTPAPGQQFGLAGFLFGTNRYHPLEMIPVQSVLIENAGTPLAANGGNTHNPTDYYAGPVMIGGSVSQTARVDMLTLQESGASTTVASIDTTAGVDIQTMLIAPPSFWWIAVFNKTAAAANDFIRATPSVTGSS